MAKIKDEKKKDKYDKKLLKEDKKEADVLEVDSKKVVLRWDKTEEVDVEALRNTKKVLEECLKEKEPDQEELIAVGRANHPYYSHMQTKQYQLDEVNTLLEKIDG